jgi:predicted DNA-binding WGR domain protein
MMMIELRHIDPAKNMRRFYRLDTQPDPFRGVFLMKEWGRIGTPGSVPNMGPADHEIAEQVEAIDAVV